MAEITRRSFLAGMIGSITSSLLPNVSFAGKNLKLTYASYKNKLVLKIIVRKNESYASISQLYTGAEKNTNEIRVFNNNQALKPEDKIYIPADLLRNSLKVILEENEFITYEIDDQGEKGIDTLFEIADEFLNDKFSLEDRLAILLILNTEINPISKIIYPGQKILLPKSCINTKLSQEVRQEVNESPRINVVEKTRQNPFKTDVKYIRAHLRPQDLFGARRIRGSSRRFWISKHTGIDLVAPIGTPLYPIESGIVLEARKATGQFWRNGIFVRYRTNSGLEVMYLHLSKENVSSGQKITTATLLGRVGITGNASKNNPHVHIQIKKNGKVVDPLQFVLN